MYAYLVYSSYITFHISHFHRRSFIFVFIYSPFILNGNVVVVSPLVANILNGNLFFVIFKFFRTFASPIRINKRSCVFKLIGCRNGNLAVKSSTKLLQLPLLPKRRKFRRRSSMLTIGKKIHNEK